MMSPFLHFIATVLQDCRHLTKLQKNYNETMKYYTELFGDKKVNSF